MLLLLCFIIAIRKILQTVWEIFLIPPHVFEKKVSLLKKEKRIITKINIFFDVMKSGK